MTTPPVLIPPYSGPEGLDVCGPGIEEEQPSAFVTYVDCGVCHGLSAFATTEFEHCPACNNTGRVRVTG